jgi:predicted transport protein
LSSLAEVAAILVMQLSANHDSGRITADDFQEALELLESYVFRRVVCGLQTRGYWQLFANLAYRIDPEEPLASLQVALRRLRESYRFPRDIEFAREFKQRDVYGMRTCHYLLDRIENHDNREPTNTANYTIEHILPQNVNLSRAWVESLGPTWKEIQQEWVHRLGNLTLTGYNSTYSDRPFNEKKTIQGGFNESSVRLNRWVREQETWTETQIEERGKAISALALNVWPPLQVSDDAVRRAERQDLRARALKRDVADVPMSAKARNLFEALRPMILGLGKDSIVEMAEQKSVSYHAADFFLEVLPRKHRLLLLLNLDFGECGNDEQAGDASEYKFYFHAKYSGGVNYRIDDASHINGALSLIRKAYELALD